MNAADCSWRVSTSSMLRAAQRLDDVEILLAGHAENVLDTLVLQRGDQQVGAFGHDYSPLVETFPHPGSPYYFGSSAGDSESGGLVAPGNRTGASVRVARRPRDHLGRPRQTTERRPVMAW